MTPSREDRKAVVEATAEAVRVCVLCRLHEARAHAVPGDGPPDAAVLLLGEAPGKDEDASGHPFVGRAGRVLDRALAAANLPRTSVFVTNVVKCRPPRNRAPKADEMEACRPFLLTQVCTIRPKVLVTLGSTALRGLLGPGHELGTSRGKPLEFEGIPVVATYHPAAVLYNRSLEGALRRDLKKVARRVREKRIRIRSGPPRSDRPTRPTASSGGVIADGSGRILLLKRADEAIWCLPKGTVEPGETLVMTALREIREETGLAVRLGEAVRTIEYSYYWPPEDVNYRKTVVYFLAEPVGGRLQLEEGFDDSRWVRRQEALRLLHWKNDSDVVTKAFELLKAAKD